MFFWWWFNCVLMMYEFERSIGAGMAGVIVLPLVWAMMAIGAAIVCAALCGVAATMIAFLASH